MDPWTPQQHYPKVIQNLCADATLCEADELQIECKSGSHLEIHANCTGRPKFFKLRSLSLELTGNKGMKAAFTANYNISGPADNWILLDDRTPHVGDERWNLTQTCQRFFNMTIDPSMVGKSIDHFVLAENAGSRDRWEMGIREIGRASCRERV